MEHESTSTSCSATARLSSDSDSECDSKQQSDPGRANAGRPELTSERGEHGAAGDVQRARSEKREWRRTRRSRVGPSRVRWRGRGSAELRRLALRVECATRQTDAGATRLTGSGAPTRTRQEARNRRHETVGRRHEAGGTRHEARGTRHKTGGTKQEAGGRRQEAGGTRQEASARLPLSTLCSRSEGSLSSRRRRAQISEANADAAADVRGRLICCGQAAAPATPSARGALSRVRIHHEHRLTGTPANPKANPRSERTIKAIIDITVIVNGHLIRHEEAQ